MKTFAWSFGCAAVFVVAGLWATLGAWLNVAMFHWSAARGFESSVFPNEMLRLVVGGAGLLLLGVGMSCLVSTWRCYRGTQARMNSPWRRKMRF